MIRTSPAHNQNPKHFDKKRCLWPSNLQFETSCPPRASRPSNCQRNSSRPQTQNPTPNFQEGLTGDELRLKSLSIPPHPKPSSLHGPIVGTVLMRMRRGYRGDAARGGVCYFGLGFWFSTVSVSLGPRFSGRCLGLRVQRFGFVGWVLV